MWYWRPSSHKSYNHESWPMENIRKKYGSYIVYKQLNLELEWNFEKKNVLFINLPCEILLCNKSSIYFTGWIILIFKL